MCRRKNGIRSDWTVEPLNARSMLDAAAATAAATATGRTPADRTAPPAVAGSPCRHQPESQPRLFADRDRGCGAPRRFRHAQPDRPCALFRLCRAASSGFHWEYVAAIVGMTATAVICFQAADIYEVQVFRGQLRQMTRMISSWAFVFLLFIGASFFAKLGSEISRIWLVVVLLRRPCGPARSNAPFLRTLVRSWARQGRLDRRTIVVGSDQNGEQLVEALKTQRRFRHRRARRVRRPQRQPRARYLRRQPEARQGRRHRRIRPPHPRRPRAVRAADLGRDAHPRNAEEAVGAAGRHPPVGAHQQAALPPPLLFLSRRGADARRVRGADHRLGPGDEVAVRPRRRRPDPAAGAARDGAGRARDQARQPRPGAVPPEAVRLQQ